MEQSHEGQLPRTDWRGLCEELVDALDSGIASERILNSPAANRARAALAAEAAEADRAERGEMERG